MVDEYAAGATRKSLAAKYGVHEQTVLRQARKAGAKQPDRVTGEVLAEFAAGVPVEALAKRCGVSAEEIARRARLAGVRAGRVAPSADMVGEIVELYEQGARIIEIGKRFGMGVRQARQVLVGAGVEIRPRGRRPLLEDRRGEVERLRGQGWSYARIGARFGVNASTVRDHAAQWGCGLVVSG